MNVIKIVIIFFALCLCIQVQSSITIDIEPDDLQHLGEILVQSYLERGIHRVTPVNNIMFSC